MVVLQEKCFYNLRKRPFAQWNVFVFITGFHAKEKLVLLSIFVEFLLYLEIIKPKGNNSAKRKQDHRALTVIVIYLVKLPSIFLKSNMF